jgi:transcriptional regulator with XRE-family HTH domain
VARICLNKVLEKKKITKYAFAKMLGKPTSGVTPYFKPGYNPRLSTIELWAKKLNVSVKDLIED